MAKRPLKNPNQLAHDSLKDNDPTSWFEELYARADVHGNGVPWAKMRPNSYLESWLEENKITGNNRKTLVVGCGLGDDAEALAERGFAVTAFDVSDSAIELCKERFPDSTVNYLVADLLNPPKDWQRAFEFVYESITVQALPPDIQPDAMHKIANMVTVEGNALVMTSMQTHTTIDDGPPWLLEPGDLAVYEEAGLRQIAYHKTQLREVSPVWHITAYFCRPAAPSTTDKSDS